MINCDRYLPTNTVKYDRRVSEFTKGMIMISEWTPSVDRFLLFSFLFHYLEVPFHRDFVVSQNFSIWLYLPLLKS